MRSIGFLAGTVLGGALVAACLSDTFRDKCRQTLCGVGNELNKQIAGLMREVSGNATQKEQANDGYERG